MYSQDNPGDRYIDLRDVATRYADELENDEEDRDNEYIEAVQEMLRDYFDVTPDEFSDFADDQETMIADDEFEDYARQLAEDIGAIDPDANWPLNRIDWQAAAEDLAIDYSSVTFGGYEYLIRSY